MKQESLKLEIVISALNFQKYVHGQALKYESSRYDGIRCEILSILY